MVEIAVGIVGAVIGFVSGLLTPWVKWEVDKRRERLAYRRRTVELWRTAIDREKHEPTDSRSDFLASPAYTSLRPHLSEEARRKVEAPRTVYVGGGRGDSVRKQVLLDEVARIERTWALL